MTPDSPVTVLLVDDDALALEAVAGYLGTAPDLRVVGRIQDAAEAVALTQESAPDVILMDVRMPGMDGVQATREIARLAPAVHVLALTSFEDDDSIAGMLGAGAVGYVVKTDHVEKVIQAVRAASLGLSVVPTKTAGRWAADHVPASAAPQLTERERTVLGLLGGGLANRQIADRLYLSTSSVKSAVAALLAKFGVRNRAELVGKAHQLGLRGTQLDAQHVPGR